MTRNVLHIRRVFDAPRDEVFDAWTRPEVVRCWWGSWPADEAPVMELDLRVGGTFRFAMKLDSGTEWVTGRFTEVTPPRRLGFTFRWESQTGPETDVTIELEDRGDGTTELVLRHDISNHENACVEGWEEQLVELEQFLAR